MKKLLILLAVATLPAARGCCCRRLCPFCPCNWFNRTAVCAPAAPTYCPPPCAAPTYVPSPCAASACAPCALCSGLCERANGFAAGGLNFPAICCASIPIRGAACGCPTHVLWRTGDWLLSAGPGLCPAS